MGLFMGFSFISIAEFIYYAILRPYHVVKRHERLTRVSNMSSYQNSQNHSLRFMGPPTFYVRDNLLKPSKLQQFPPRIIERRNSESSGQFVKPYGRQF